VKVRRQLSRRPVQGYPQPKFIGYCMRFGVVNAAFITAGLQVWSKECAPQISRSGSILFYTYRGLEAEIADRKKSRHNWEPMQHVLDTWPPAWSKLLKELTACPGGLRLP
jgi:hypothetical protein